MNKLSGGEIARIITIIVAVLLESIALLSIALSVSLLPIGTSYPRVVSAVVILLPTLIGLLSIRWEAAIVMGVLPFWVMGVVYDIVYAPIWNLDLLSIGSVLTPFVSVSAFAAGLSYLGWLLRRIFFGRQSTQYP